MVTVLYECSYICELDDRIVKGTNYKLDVKSGIGWYYASRGIFDWSLSSAHSHCCSLAVRGAVGKRSPAVKTFRTLLVCFAMAMSFGSYLCSNDSSCMQVGHTSSPHDLSSRLAHFCWASSANEPCHSAMKLRFLCSDACALASILPLLGHAFARWSGWPQM